MIEVRDGQLTKSSIEELERLMDQQAHIEILPNGEIRASPDASETSDAESLARLFHETYERLAPDHGYETRKASAKPWSEVPEQNKNLMIAVCRLIGPRVERARRLAQPVAELVEAYDEWCSQPEDEGTAEAWERLDRAVDTLRGPSNVG